MQPDFGPTARDYRRHRADFPHETVAALQSLGVGLASQDLVDVGTGTGGLARLLAAHAGHVRGIDPSVEMLAAARQMATDAGLAIDFTLGTAEHTGLADSSADAVTVGQAWHWFDRDAAAVELRRVLRPGSPLAIVHFDWLPLDDTLVARTEALILQANPSWSMGGGTGMYPQWLVDLERAGYGDLRTFSFDIAVPYSRIDWVGRIRASAGIGGSLDAAAVEAFSDVLDAMVARDFGDDFDVLHRVWGVVGRSPSD